ncbi:hypothetical protein [Archaeoglobus sp.]
MEVIQVTKEELEEIIEKKLREALLKVFMEIIPYVSDEEEKEIEEIAGSPEDYDEGDFEEWDG